MWLHSLVVKACLIGVAKVMYQARFFSLQKTAFLLSKLVQRGSYKSASQTELVQFLLLSLFKFIC